jgi:hypothetical protein
MKNIFLFSFLVSAFIFFGVKGADRLPTEGKNEIAGTTTLFVLDGGEVYNKDLQEIVAKVWTITPYKFITPEEMKTYFGNKKYCLAFRGNYQTSGGLKFSYLQIFKGLKNMTWASMSNSVGSVYLPEEPEETIDMLLPNFVERLQMFCLDTDKSFSPKGRKERARQIRSKTMYILKRQVKGDANEFLEKAKKVYPYKIEVVEDNQLREAIYNLDTSVCYCYDTNRGAASVINAGSAETMLVVDGSYNNGIIDIGYLRNIMGTIGRPK